MSHNYKIINAQCTLNLKIWVNKEMFPDYLLSLLECWTLTYIFSFYMYSKYTFSSMHYESSTLTVELWFFGTMLYYKLHEKNHSAVMIRENLFHCNFIRTIEVFYKIWITLGSSSFTKQGFMTWVFLFMEYEWTRCLQVKNKIVAYKLL